MPTVIEKEKIILKKEQDLHPPQKKKKNTTEEINTCLSLISPHFSEKLKMCSNALLVKVWSTEQPWDITQERVRNSESQASPQTY